MVNGALSLGGIVGVLLSGAFVYWEIGRFAAPQVPRSLFDERKEVFAYTAGLFVGVPLAFVFLLLASAIQNGAVLSAAIDVLVLVGATELVQWVVARSYYFGHSESTPFYLLGLRAGIAGILILGAVTAYLGSPSIQWDGLVLTGAEALALLAIQVNGALVSIPRKGEATGGPLSGVVVGAAALAVLSLGLGLGGLLGTAAALLVLGGLVPSYRRLRRRLLDGIQRASEGVPAQPTEDRPFGRTRP